MGLEIRDQSCPFSRFAPRTTQTSPVSTGFAGKTPPNQPIARLPPRSSG
jgi:hypothetical protein